MRVAKIQLPFLHRGGGLWKDIDVTLFSSKMTLGSLSAAMALLTMTIFSPTASAATCNWTGGSGDWHDPVKWSCGQVPTDLDDVTLNLSSFGATVTINAPAPGEDAHADQQWRHPVRHRRPAGQRPRHESMPSPPPRFLPTGRALPSLAVSQGSGGFYFHLDRPSALTADSLSTVTISGVVQRRQHNGAGCRRAQYRHPLLANRQPQPEGAISPFLPA